MNFHDVTATITRDDLLQSSRLKNVVIEFQNIIDVINSQMQTQGVESSKLANIRDIILPKLMSGEIEVK